MWSRSAQLCKEFFGSVLTRKLGKGTKIFLSLVIIFYSIISVVMVALWNRANHYIFSSCFFFFLLSSFFMAALCNRGAIIFLPCDFYLLSFFYLFFPRLISAATDRMSAILLHMAWP